MTRYRKTYLPSLVSRNLTVHLLILYISKLNTNIYFRGVTYNYDFRNMLVYAVSSYHSVVLSSIYCCPQSVEEILIKPTLNGFVTKAKRTMSCLSQPMAEHRPSSISLNDWNDQSHNIFYAPTPPPPPKKKKKKKNNV